MNEFDIFIYSLGVNRKIANPMSEKMAAITNNDIPIPRQLRSSTATATNSCKPAPGIVLDILIFGHQLIDIDVFFVENLDKVLELCQKNNWFTEFVTRIHTKKVLESSKTSEFVWHEYHQLFLKHVYEFLYRAKYVV